MEDLEVIDGTIEVRVLRLDKVVEHRHDVALEPPPPLPDGYRLLEYVHYVGETRWMPSSTMGGYDTVRRSAS